MSKKRVAIIFYGLTRTLKRTIEAYHENVFKVLSENSIEYDIFVHTYKLNGPYSNIWINEHIAEYENEDVEQLLHPKYFIHDDQIEISNSIDFEEYYTNLGDWSGGWPPELTKYVIKNMSLALYSKKRITEVFEQHKENYDYAIITRPELLFQQKISVNLFDELTDKNIIVPSQDEFSGCNDRFCIGKVENVLYYGKLFDHLKDYSRVKSICSERYCAEKLVEKGLTLVKKNDIVYTTLSRIYG